MSEGFAQGFYTVTVSGGKRDLSYMVSTLTNQLSPTATDSTLATWHVNFLLTTLLTQESETLLTLSLNFLHQFKFIAQ